MATASAPVKKRAAAKSKGSKAAPATREPAVPLVTTTNTASLLHSRNWHRMDLLRCRHSPDNTMVLAMNIKQAIGVYRVRASIDDPLRPLTAELLYELTSANGQGKPPMPVTHLWNERLDEFDAVCGEYMVDGGQWYGARFNTDDGYAPGRWKAESKGMSPVNPDATEKPIEWTKTAATKLLPSHPFSVERGRHVDVDSECGMRYAVNTLDDRAGSSYWHCAPWGLFYQALLLPCTHRLKNVVVMIAVYDPATDANVACFVLGTYEANIGGASHDGQFVRFVFGNERGTMAMILDHSPTVQIMVAGPNNSRERARICVDCPVDYSRADVDAAFLDDHHLLVMHRLPDRSAWEAGLYTVTPGADA